MVQGPLAWAAAGSMWEISGHVWGLLCPSLQCHKVSVHMHTTGREALALDLDSLDFQSHLPYYVGVGKSPSLSRVSDSSSTKCRKWYLLCQVLIKIKTRALVKSCSKNVLMLRTILPRSPRRICRFLYNNCSSSEEQGKCKGAKVQRESYHSLKF